MTLHRARELSPSGRRAGRIRRAAAWSALTVVATGLLLALTVQPAMAHATLMSTTPADDETLESAPSAVELRFDEPVEVVDGAVEVFGPDGERVDEGRVDVDGAVLAAPRDGAARGTYTVAWRVLSGDSHNLSGSFVFHVGEQTGAVAIDDSDDQLVQVVAWLGRFLALAGVLVLLGAAFLRLLHGPEGLVSARLRALAIGASGVGVLGMAIVLITRVAESSGRSILDALSLVPDFALDTRSGRLALTGLAAVAVGLAATWRRRLWERVTWLPCVAAVVAMMAISASGHPWTAEARWVAIATDVGHQIAAGVWVGGAAGLAVALRASGDRRRLARRFSTAALFAAVLVATTGTISALIQIGSWEALTSTGFGQLVLVKVGAFVVLVTFGYLNRRHLVPIVERTVSPLVRSVRWEVLVAAGVLMVTAVLVDQPPGRTSLAQPYDATEVVGEATVQLTVTPARAGTNDLHLYFYVTGSGEVLAVDAVEVTASTSELPPRRLEVTPVTASHVSVFGASLTAPGSWTIDVTLVSAGSPSTVSFEVPIR